jgi:hypothetical protein
VRALPLGCDPATTAPPPAPPTLPHKRRDRRGSATREEVAMQLDPPAHGGEARRRLRTALVWGGVTLLAAVALALAMVIASLALQLGSEPAPPPPPTSTSPIPFGTPGGHPTAQ